MPVTDLSIVIVSWNVRDRLRECLASLAASVRDPAFTYTVCVVDNASSDGSAEMVRAEFPVVQRIANHENRGFAAACNQGARMTMVSAPEFVLFLNPDMRVTPGCLEGVVSFLRQRRNARVGIAGCRLTDERGETIPHVRRFPRLTDQLAILCKLPHLFPRVLRRYLVEGFDAARESRVDSVRGSCFCVRSELLRTVGLFDEGFFLWFEEVDLCTRARQAGWEIAYTPSVTCVDHVGRSFAQLRMYPKQTQFTKSMLRYFRKHRPAWEWVVLAAVRPFVLAAARVYDVLHA